MRYELFRLAQLAFALFLMFGAFLGGVAVGWWRWERQRHTRDTALSSAQVTSPTVHRRVNPGLFTPAEPHVAPADPVAVPGLLTVARPEELTAPVDPFA